METPSEDIFYAIVASTIVILLLVIILISLLQVSRNRRLKHINEVLEMTSAFQNEMNATKHEVMEQVLNDVAIELHDNVGQTLTHAILSLDRIPESPTGQVAETRVIMRQAIQDLREISHMLSGDYWSRFDLGDALKILQQRLERSNSIKAGFHVSEHFEKLKKDTEILILRVIQELVNNSLKHAKADTISLSVSENAEHLVIHYTDNGIGLPANIQPGGLGMTSIKTRMELCKAQWSIASPNHKGITFDATIPL